MIDRMTRYSFILLSGDKDSFLRTVQELGVVDITRSAKAMDEHSEQLLARTTAIRKRIAEIKAGSDRHLESLNEEKNRLEAERTEAAHWGEFDADKLEALGIDISFYHVSRKKFDPEWADRYALEIISETKEEIFFVIAGDTDGMPVKVVAAPERAVGAIDRDINAKVAEIEAYKAGLSARSSEIPAMESEAAELSAELSRYLASVSGESAAQDSLVIYEGFAPSDMDEELCKALDDMDMIYLKEAARIEDNPPIALKNNWFVRMFEPLTDMYGRPAYNGFDPTPYISIFFLLFFAMCMGDAGYGLILIIAGLLLKKVKSFASLAPLVVTLGCGTVVIGLLFHTFFSIDISTWDCIPDALRKCMIPSKIAGYDGTMVLALAVGIIHLCLAMLVKAIYAIRNNGFINSLGVCGWTFLIVGSTAVGAAHLAGVLDSAVTKTVIIVIGIVSAAGIFLLNDMQRNPLKNIGSGLWETYNTATGVLGDVLSYLRLYALGLAGGMLGFAFNDLAKMALGDGGFGWVPFILIVIIGHTLNLAMAALGAFVHPLRLNFLEFFKNSGYEGVGRAYNPLKK